MRRKISSLRAAARAETALRRPPLQRGQHRGQVGGALQVLVTLLGLARWRRGCATDGHEMTDNSEAQPDTLGQLGKLLLK